MELMGEMKLLKSRLLELEEYSFNKVTRLIKAYTRC